MKRFHRMALALIVGLLGLGPLTGAPGPTQAAQALTWRATGVQLGPGANGALCFDASRPNVVADLRGRRRHGRL